MKKVHCTLSTFRHASKRLNSERRNRRLGSRETGVSDTKARFAPTFHSRCPPDLKFQLKSAKSDIKGGGSLQGSPLASGASGAKQEMFEAVASVRLTRHYTRICSLGMLLCSRLPAHQILMLRRALYYI